MTQLEQIKCDRMRYTKDKLSANLVLLAIVLDCLYFISIYKSDVGSYYYSWTIGASIVYNLLFLLTAFLASESVKSRKSGFTAVLLGVGMLQFVRMAYLPAKAHAAMVQISGSTVRVMENGQYAFALICLAASGACCIAAAIVSFRNHKKLAAYMSSLTENMERID